MLLLVSYFHYPLILNPHIYIYFSQLIEWAYYPKILEIILNPFFLQLQCLSLLMLPALRPASLLYYISTMFTPQLCLHILTPLLSCHQFQSLSLPLVSLLHPLSPSTSLFWVAPPRTNHYFYTDHFCFYTNHFCFPSCTLIHYWFRVPLLLLFYILFFISTLSLIFMMRIDYHSFFIPILC